jgi:cysteine desulfurase
MLTAFLDHQSSTPLLPEVWEAMRPFFSDTYGSPSSLHRQGVRARAALAAAREQLAGLIHAGSPEEILFTSGGTEAANLAVKGVCWASQRRGNHIVASSIEHPAVMGSIEFLENNGFTCTRVGVDREGFVDPEAIRAASTEQTILVCVHHVNHDVGTIQRIREVAEVTSQKGVPLFVDAVASAGWLPIDVQSLGIDLLSLTAHRFYGPKGAGVLYKNRRVRLASLIHGGDQEQGRRAGTENVPAIAGAGKAAEVAARTLPERAAHTRRLQEKLWEGVRKSVPYVALNGPEPGPARASTNLNVSAEFTEAEGQTLSLDMAGIAVASGRSCVSKAIKVSPVLQAMGLDRGLAGASIIFSLGKDNTDLEIDYAIGTYARLVEKLRNLSPLWEEFQAGAIDSIVEPRKKGSPSRGSQAGGRFK